MKKILIIFSIAFMIGSFAFLGIQVYRFHISIKRLDKKNNEIGRMVYNPYAFERKANQFTGIDTLPSPKLQMWDSSTNSYFTVIATGQSNNCRGITYVGKLERGDKQTVRKHKDKKPLYTITTVNQSGGVIAGSVVNNY